MSFDLSLQRSVVYEWGARLLSVIACAREVDDGRAFQLYLSLCGRALWSKHLSAPDDWEPITVKPQYVFRRLEIIDRDVGFVERRLGERMVAGRMAIPYLQKAFTGGGSLPGGIRRLSLNQMAEFAIKDAGQSDASNLKRRYWAPSRPVIHLAAAAAIVEQERRRSGQSIDIQSFLLDGALIEEIVRGAEELAGLIASDPKFPVKADQLIRFRLS